VEKHVAKLEKLAVTKPADGDHTIPRDIRKGDEINFYEPRKRVLIPGIALKKPKKDAQYQAWELSVRVKSQSHLEAGDYIIEYFEHKLDTEPAKTWGLWGDL